MSKVKRNTCGDCWYYSPWTGDCCFAGAFVDVRHDRPACEHFDLCTEER